MINLTEAVDRILTGQTTTEQPLAAILAGHNGSGKSTMWRRHLADRLQLPLINADRMMLSILPEPGTDGRLTDWAQYLRDHDSGWMRVAQQGVGTFIGHAIGARVPFAVETVFSDWRPQPDGTVRSKLDLIRELQDVGYFVVLFFVGLDSADLSVMRIATRIAEGGHAVDPSKLRARFPRTQTAIREAAKVADATIFMDNSRSVADAFTVCRVQLGRDELFDIRQRRGKVPSPILVWMNVVAPLT